MPQRATSFVLRGGLDLVTPPISIKPGCVAAAVNHEAVAEGYRRVDGYERYDGRPLASAAQYWVLPFKSGTLALAAGTLINRDTIIANAVLLTDGILESGSYANGTAAGRLVIALINGTWADNSVILVAGNQRALGAGDPIATGAATDAEDRAWRRLASDRQRALIGVVPGTGPVRFVWALKGVNYAIRDFDGTTARLYRATPTGWTVVSTGAVTLPAGGTWRGVNYNFTGNPTTEALYLVSGVGKALQFDGTTATAITSGATDDRPIWIAAHKNHLFLAFRGGQLIYSRVGLPLDYNTVLGAGSIAFGTEITGLLSGVSNTMIVFGANRISAIYGAPGDADFEMRVLSESAGAVAQSVQHINTAIYLDDSGVRSLETTQSFGDFRAGTLTNFVDPLVRSRRRAVGLEVASLRVKGKDTYRLFWPDGTGLAIYLGGRAPEVMPFDLQRIVRCCASVEDASGNEVLLFGSDDGYVYVLDSGPSFDGAIVPAYLRLHFFHVIGASYQARFHKVVMKLDAAPATRIGLTAEFSYGSSSQPPQPEQTFSVSGSGGFWNQSNWNEFFWSSQAEGQAEAYIDGLGNNISVTILSDEDDQPPYVLNACTIHFSERRMSR